MEYVALQVPVVIARWPTFEHYFGDDAVTYFATGDAKELANAVLRIARDPAGARAKVDRARRVNADYAWQVQGAHYLAIHRALMSRTEPALQLKEAISHVES